VLDLNRFGIGFEFWEIYETGNAELVIVGADKLFASEYNARGTPNVPMRKTPGSRATGRSGMRSRNRPSRSVSLGSLTVALYSDLDLNRYEMGGASHQPREGHLE
jgi:hypothetical protein